jgi:hypothetical protein
MFTTGMFTTGMFTTGMFTTGMFTTGMFTTGMFTTGRASTFDRHQSSQMTEPEHIVAGRERNSLLWKQVRIVLANVVGSQRLGATGIAQSERRVVLSGRFSIVACFWSPA